MMQLMMLVELSNVLLISKRNYLNYLAVIMKIIKMPLSLLLQVQAMQVIS
ncbi:Uncharacterised protein [Acinetobacter baumannii]|nr:Uncharacterised protein [Acinetobacter baumannii]SWT41873.1 Uncharacterised protein [Klebsiella pneumoniae]